MTRGSLTQTEAAILLAVAIFTGFTTVSLVLVGFEAGVIWFNVTVFVVALFGLSTDVLDPLGETEASR